MTCFFFQGTKDIAIELSTTLNTTIMERLSEAFDGLTEETKDVFLRACGGELKDALVKIAPDVNTLSPPIQHIFNAVKLCPVENTRVVLIGQDPYPTGAVGMSFSVKRGDKVPPSLLNIYKCLCARGLMTRMPTHGDLTYWAQQGVLLLNMSLTTRIGESASHPSWHTYTRQCIETLCSVKNQLSFILLGDDAKSIASIITAPHRIHTWGHPSPLSRKNQTQNPLNFINCTCFEETNRDMELLNTPPICWDPDGFLAAKPQPAAQPIPVVAVAYAESPVAKPMIAPFVYVAAQPPPPPVPAQTATWPTGTVSKTRRVQPNDPIPPTGNVLYVFTDGGATNNGKPNCVASWGCMLTDGCTMTFASALVPLRDLGQKYKTSNQRGELSALLHALQYVEHATEFVYTEILVISDSKYSIDCIESWAPKWRRGSKTPNDLTAFAKYKNTDLIFPALDATLRIRERVPITFKHQMSHLKNEDVPTDPLGHFIYRGNQIVDAACSLLLPKPT